MSLPLPFSAPHASDDRAIVARYLHETALPESAEARIDATATRLIEAIRADAGAFGVEEFLREYSLSTREGLALMALAEALLRVPDAATADRLIEDKLGQSHFTTHEAKSEGFLVNASTWALGLTARILQPSDTPESLLGGLVKRLGAPTVRVAARQAMRIMGHQFVLGETIADALDRARALEAKGYRHSYDMLGEGARTQKDADRYFKSYADAIEAIGRAAGNKPLPDRPGISVKLSALHPRYEATHADRVLTELVPKLTDLAIRARSFDLNLTVDAEEADRLELSLDVIARVALDPRLEGWSGFGLAIQAYQKRAIDVIAFMDDLASRAGRRFMVRLVKGAYWDTEIKRAQERGLEGYAVFTRKAATDLSYLACAKRLLAARPRLYPQFATHNALTVAQILELAGDRTGFEFQRLHGMGDALYRAVTEGDKLPCRIYAPVGGHRDLLAYLVRRLLENGANSSFVAKVGDPAVPIRTLLTRPGVWLENGAAPTHPGIKAPVDLYGDRKNSMGLEFGDRQALSRLLTLMNEGVSPTLAATPLVDGKPIGSTPARPVVSPSDGARVGSVVEATPEEARAAMAIAARAVRATRAWPVQARAEALEKAADLIEARRARLMALLAMEAGKTLPDALSEVREAADFCRYYAREARRLFGADQILAGPTGEENRYRHRGRGVFVAISPWNFPLAIFLGQVSAALAAGNVVVAKPAPQTPLIAYETVKLLFEAGVPVNALHLVPGGGATGGALVAAKETAGVVFTGSTTTAHAINRALVERGGPIVPLIAETGGLNAMIVDATALAEQVTDDVVASAFRSAGQRCSALRLLYVQADVADQMIEMIAGAAAELALGDPSRAATDMGPVIDAAAKAKIDAHVAKWRAAGKVVFEGKAPASPGTYVAPTIIKLDRSTDLTEEIFGPVLHVVTYKAGDLAAVVDQIEATGYGLTLGIHSRIDATIEFVRERVTVGNVYVNRNVIGAVVGVQPFGGSGLSGTGPKAGGPDYLARFALEQTISTNTAAAGGNASLIAMGDG